MKTKMKLMLLVVAMAVIFGASMNPVSAATLTLDETVEVSYHKSDFNISVYPGKASYSGSWEIDEIVYESAGVFGDGTVLGYRFFNSDGLVMSSYADDGTGIVAPVVSPPEADLDGTESWANVWTTTDPGVDFATAADITEDTLTRGSNITGTIDISSLSSGTVYVICGGLKNDLSLTLAMSGAGQTDIQAEYSVNPGSLNKFWVAPFDFSDAGGYDTITYTYTFSTARRGRFVGVIIDNVVSDANVPDVDAGPDMISWSGALVALDPTIVEAPGSDWTNLTYLWTAAPDGIGDPNLDVAITGANTENASVTVTKAEPTGDATIIAMTLAVNDAGRTDPPVKSIMTIDVYDDACLATKAAGPVELDITDIDENCITAFPDFAVRLEIEHVELRM